MERFVLGFILCSCSTFLTTFGLILTLQQFFAVPYVPSSPKKLRLVLQKLGIKPGSNFLDMGSGDGGQVLMAAGFGLHATGIEINPYLFLICALRRLIHPKRKNIHFIWGSFFKQNLSKYDVVYTYLFPSVVNTLEEKLFSELPTGATIITHTFTFQHRQPSQIIDKYFYVYRV